MIAVIRDGDTTLNVAGTPWNVTLVAPVGSVPKIPTADPTLPDVGSVFTNGPKPTERLKNYAKAVGTALEGCAVEFPIGGLYKPRGGVTTVHALALRTQAVDGC